MKGLFNHLMALWILALFGCASVAQIGKKPASIDYSARNSVRAEETLAIAESFRIHRWKPTKKNVWHGADQDGILVHTPDISLQKGLAARKGWWLPGEVNVGIPYTWGGFDTPQSFDEKLKRGFFAGDVYTKQKRRVLYAGVSRQTCGVDCSGFISRCWRLERAYSTRELPSLCKKLESFSDLKAGDLVNKRNVHALLFVRFLDPEKKVFLAYETGSAPSWKVLRHPISVKYVKSLGYLPYRYRGMIQE